MGIGSASFLSDPTLTKMRFISTLHHFWFLPYCFYLLYIGKTFVHKNTFKATIVIASMLSCLGRILCNKFMWVPITKTIQKRFEENKHEMNEQWKMARKKDMECSKSLVYITSKDQMHYLEYFNVNCGFEMMHFLNAPFLHICDKKNAFIYLSYLSLTMHTINYVPYLMMKRISDAFLMQNAQSPIN